MHEILNIDLVKNSALMDRVNGIADQLLKDLPIGVDGDAAYQQELLERVLQYAAQAEQELMERDQRIAYLQDLSLTDELTELLNRRGFDESLTRALAMARRYGHKGMLLYCDLDSFKSVNDTYGHAAGDQLLRHTATILAESVRECDIVGRLGGDEFAVALVQTSWANGAKRARTLQWQLDNSRLEFEGNMIPVKISIGCEPFGPDDNIDDLICRADMAMYCTKRGKVGMISQSAAE